MKPLFPLSWQIAILWAFASAFSLGPLVPVAKNPETGPALFQATFAVTVLIAATPWLFSLIERRYGPFASQLRRWLWPFDVLSPEAKQRIDRTRSVLVLRLELRKSAFLQFAKPALVGWLLITLALDLISEIVPWSFGWLYPRVILMMLGFALYAFIFLLMGLVLLARPVRNKR